MLNSGENFIFSFFSNIRIACIFGISMQTKFCDDGQFLD